MENGFKPKLLHVKVQRTIYQGQPVFLIHNSLQLSEMAIMLPQGLGPLAMLCDGLHTLPELETTLAGQYGLNLSRSEIEYLLEQFDEALVLEGDRLKQAIQAAVEDYRAAPFRKPALAGTSYPARVDDLRRLLQTHLNKVNGIQPSAANSRGIICPHIDFERGGRVYAQVWASAAEAVRQAELIIIFGTDHHGSEGMLTLTRQNYASPFGQMPTDNDVVDRLVDVLGEEAAFAEELHHRDEWSIELDLVWIQHMRDAKPCPMVPILCGSFSHFMMGEANIESETKFRDVAKVLRQEMNKRRTVIVASGDLAHMGPAFDGNPLDADAKAQMKVEDHALMATLCRGDARLFLEFMKGQYDRNVCGLSPFYFTLDVLEETTGRTIAYDRCPADYADTSFVSICGTVLA